MKKALLLLFLVAGLLQLDANAQGVGIGTTTPDASAVLDLTSTTQGLLAPRHTTVQRLAIRRPAPGLLVFDTDSAALYLYGGSAIGWHKLAALDGRGPVVQGLAAGNLLVWTGTQWRASTPCEALGPYLMNLPDLPDPAFLDSNCDGIDGKAADAIFVAPTGLDTNPGTQTAPMLTPAAAIAAAVAQGKTQVLLAQGSYPGPLPLTNGVAVVGGYSASTWARNASYVSTITASTPSGGVLIAAEGSNLTTSTLVERLNLVATSTSVPGTSVYGVRCTTCPGLVLRNCVITAGNAGPGLQGVAGIAGASGRGGNAGGSGLCDIEATVSGGASTIGSCGSANSFGGAGGAGGKGNQAGPAGSNGLGGGVIGGGANSTNGGGGPGGLGNRSTGLAGGNGVAGTAASGTGTNGAGGVGGSFVVSAWVSDAGDTGGTGPAGGGGAGGGGGGGQFCTFCQSGTGNGGGSGGGGGCGGNGGGGGAGGGGSFGVVLISSTNCVLTDNTITTGNGGAGGSGSTGGGGGIGGSGGPGGQSCTGEVGAGGNGGIGGAGGLGGVGGGGAGGPSVGIYRVGTALNTAGNTITVGSGGSGGGAGGPGGGAGATGTAVSVAVQ